MPDSEYYYSCDCFGDYIGLYGFIHPHPAIFHFVIEGSYCEIKLSGCRSNPCLNGGTCLTDQTSSNLDYVCACKEGFTGKFCENVIEKCELICQNGGQCLQNEEDQYFCLCPDGTFLTFPFFIFTNKFLQTRFWG